jgi:lipoate-protein ligase A
MHWHLLDTGKKHAAWNMAIDEALLQWVQIQKTPVLRFYTWEAPTLSLGCFQSVQDVDLEACERWGFDWIRRPTGGRAVLHDHELTYSFVGLVELLDESVGQSYQMLSEALALGLRELGLEAEFTAPRRDVPGEKNPACFVAPSYAELTIQGKKVIGSAQMRTGRAVLQHGSIPLRLDYEVLARVLKFKHPENAVEFLQTKASGLEKFLKRSLSLVELKNAVCIGFERRFCTTFTKFDLDKEISQMACQLFAEKYSTRRWNYRR